jgi:hypothetical protein
MKTCNNLEIYYKIFRLISKNPRMMPKKISEYFRKTGRGRSPSTWLRHLSNMYKKKISRSPHIGVKPHSNYMISVYYSRKEDNTNIYNTFLDLYKDKRITYVIFLSGRDFFIASPSPDVDLRKFGLITEYKSYLYTPRYTIPKGWKQDLNKCLENMIRSEFQEGALNRDIEGKLNWNKKDWEIYRFMQSNIREKWIKLARRVDLSLSTARKRFLSGILPECYQAHYFFPRGLDYYSTMILRVRTKYEKSFAKSLEFLPCTTYVFPLKDEITITLFHDDENGILRTFEKMKEIGALKDYLLYIPIAHGY